MEVHVQLTTRTKAFCACPVEFGAPPNTLCCPVCLGHPGALPVLNREAVVQALRAGIALGCKVAPKGRTQWDRKNYFYPDLPKGYQITQYDFPLCEGGRIELSGGKPVRVRRAHLEEDTGKSSHAADGATLVDFNRSGVPLLEIVSEPDLGTAEEAEDYLRRLRELLVDSGAAECRMERGQMRCEPNVNLVRADGAATPISELKNLNSFAAVHAAVAFEARRLADGPWVPKGEIPPRATLGWDEASGRTVLQRTKETAADYRYFPEPDLLPLGSLALSELRAIAKFIPPTEELMASIGRASALQTLGDIGASERQRKSHLKGLPWRALRLLAQTLELCSPELEGEQRAAALKLVPGWFLGPLGGRVAKLPETWASLAVDQIQLAKAFTLVFQGRALPQVVKEHLLQGDWPATGGDPEAILRGKGLLGGAAGEDAVKKACEEVLAANPEVVAKIRGGKPQAKKALVGEVMKRTRGTADPARVNAILEELLR